MFSSSVIQRSRRLWSTESSVRAHGTEDEPAKQSPHQKSNPIEPFLDSFRGADFMSILDASAKYGIPSIKLRKPEQIDPKLEHQTIVLGGGLTSRVVQYAIADEDPVRVTSDRVVALKTFTRTSPSRTAKQTVYETIMREMAVLCHPMLAGHPNIVQLRFVGWRDGEPFPALAMEQGPYGSLDYLIRSSWSGLTDMQLHQVSRHITIDIAVGLHAIHQAGFIHGDLKPENILVMSHPNESRRVVVKLADFGGSSLIPGDSGGRPVHYTPLWCSPEVLNSDPDINWERADVYSYGLVVGSLWASGRGGGGFGVGRLDEPSSCFLANYVLSTMTEEEKMGILWSIKSEAVETSERGIHNLLRKSLERTLLDDICRSEVFDVLIPALRAHFWLRPCTKDLVQSLQALATYAGRDILDEINHLSNKRINNTPASYIDSSRSRGAFSWDQSRDYFSIIVGQSTIAFDEMTAMSSDLFPHVDLPESPPEDFDPLGYIEDIFEVYKKIALGNHSEKTAFEQEKFFAAKEKIARLSWFIAVSCMAEPKSLANMDTFKSMIHTSAMAGDSRAVCATSLLLHNTDMEAQFPIRFSLVLLALSQSNHAAQALYSCWPAHYSAVQKLIKMRPSAFEKAGSNIAPDSSPYLLETLKCYLRESVRREPLSFEQALKIGILEDVREVLEGDIIPTDFDVAITGSLHGLSNLPDSEASAMAPIAYQSGGKLSSLDVSGSPLAASGVFEDEPPVPNVLSPLSAAVRRGKSELALALFSLHIGNEDEPIVDFDAALMLSSLYLQHEIAELLLNFYYESPHMCLESRRLQRDSGGFLSELLLEVMVPARSYNRELERRLLHGDGHTVAYENTLRVLLDNGADPTGGFMNSSPLMNALRWDDITAIECIIEALENRGMNTLSHLRDPGNLCQDPTADRDVTALIVCIQFGSVGAFEHILQRYPCLASDANEDGSATTVLHEACDKDDRAPFVEALLRHGANVMSRNKQGQTAICCALLKGQLKAAEAIAQHCTSEQLGELLCRDPENGWSIFFKLLARWRHSKTLDMIESFRWLYRHGGLHPFGPSGIPAWYPIVESPSPFAGVEQRLDVELLRLILDVDGLDSTMNVEMREGITILHQSVWNGHYEVVKLLLESGMDPNVQMTYSGQIPEQFPLDMLDPKEKGITALDLVCSALSGLHIPDGISRGSFIEIQRWSEDLERIRSLLLERGAKGSLYDNFKQRVFSDHQATSGPEGASNALMKDGEVMTGSWPKTFVEMPTSSIPRTIEQMLADKRMESELIYNVLRSDLHQQQMNKLRELEKQAIPRDYLRSIKLHAMLRKHEWRLPPGWYCSQLTPDENGPGGYHAWYSNHATGERTSERPKLFRGELEAGGEKAKGNEVEEDIYGASPVMKPQVLSPELGISSISLQDSASTSEPQ